MDDLLETADSGRAAAGERTLSSSLMSPANPCPSDIEPERWEILEKAAHMIICKVQPTTISEERRRDVTDYVQRLIRNRLGAEVFPYGSVPLKTYLPDGDIDLTAFGGANVEDKLADDMKSVLEEEEKNRSAEFVVKDVQLICAEVKLVKCIVQNIVVDVSFNQIGGLCTLCFLEKVDRLIGKNHLFKRSIILIKAWCYYESRILGAHHGLISTYALETLVLYIFHLFHSTLDGPLAVLYKFLDYFSKFDWETYCISLNGPVRISSLPVIVAETPEDGSGDLLLTEDFLRSCVEMFSVPTRFVDQKSRGFQQKHLNIVDPLKDNNNLGRSISKGNFYRIRSAFSYGAKKLGRILLQPEDGIANELQIFFSSAMQRHGCGQKPVVQDPYPQSTYNGFIPVSSSLGTESYKLENYDNAAGHRFIGDANDLATPIIEGLNISTDSPEFRNMRNENPNSDQWGKCEKNVSSEVLGEDSDHMNWDQGSRSWSGSPESSNSLSDLSGDYDSYFNCLQYGRWCYEYTSSVPSLPLAPMPPLQYQNKTPWNGVLYPSQLRHDGFSHGHRNDFIPVYPMRQALVPGMAFGREEMPKPRGTGTYFPKMNQSPQGYRHSAVKGKNQAPLSSPRDNGRNVIFMETNLLDRNGHEQSQPQVLVDQSVNLGSSGIYQSFSPRGNGHVPVGTFSSEQNRQQSPASSSPQIPSPDSPGMQRQKTALSRDPDRVSFKSSYHLKDQDDFPPLSV
ncbi:PAP/OAS1 substrate-binding domain superfamily [Abeliophyllum distichum]|uniref:PAP/OAS1 substrate-binding domain superfamily n=1 Tax=Abeliophyllum distichum TaxID=126358 RepID=A0ABD1QUY4_9LAMI